MRKEPYSVGSIVHVIQRGVRGAPIVRSDDDRWRFLKLVRYLNDENVPRNWERDIGPNNIRDGFTRPDFWPEHKPYTSVVAFCLMDNHFHLVLRETREGGISKFMQRVSTSMAAYLNAKYQERGTPFQGSYRSRTVTSDEYLQYLNAYVLVKNPFELYQGGPTHGRAFDQAFDWASRYPFASLIDFMGNRRAQLLDYDLIRELFSDQQRHFRQFARDVIEGRKGGDIEALDEIFRRY